MIFVIVASVAPYIEKFHFSSVYFSVWFPGNRLLPEFDFLVLVVVLVNIFLLRFFLFFLGYICFISAIFPLLAEEPSLRS